MAQNSLNDLAGDNPLVLQTLKDLSKGPTEAARYICLSHGPFATTEGSVRRWRAKYVLDQEDEAISAPITHDFDQVGKGTIDITPEGAQVNNVIITSPILEDWGPVFSLFNLSANDFEVADDTVRMSTWQQSKRLDDGSRDTIQLWSYSARFRRKNRDAIPLEIRERWRDQLINNEPPLVYTNAKGMGDQTYTIMIADPQLGKKGTVEAVENWKNGLISHLHEAQRLGAYNVHLAFMGDETENVMSNYGNQAYTAELNRSQQLELDFDLSVWSIKNALKFGHVSVSSVISNHGEWTRAGLGSDTIVTTQNDNASTHIRRQVKKLFDEMEAFGGPYIDWTIGGNTPGITVNLSGVDVYFSHGYVERGKGSTTEAKMHSAVERQILGRTQELGEVPIWIMAHYHHFYTNEFQHRTLFGCPALEAEGSSEYLSNATGVWSKPGMLGMMIGTRTARRWSDLNVF